ncbi:MAG: GAF domain-containing sensor histidine kinase [Rhodospirillales bacterium]|nr:GAF domain-containing sensor histidine kinase [Rhodospirillales bacterium]
MGHLPQSNDDALSGLVTFIQKLSFARDMEGIMAVVRRYARALSGADGVTFVLRDGERCFYADEEAIAPLWKGQRFPMSACISGWCMLNRMPVVIEDIYQDPRLPHDAYRPTFVRSMVMVPIRSDDPMGAIGAYWAHIRRPTATEVELLQTIAHTTAVAIANVSLQEASRAARQDAKREETERRQAEAALHSARLELESVNLAKARFLAAASHDLRQPLQSLHLFLAALEHTHGDDSRSRTVLISMQRSLDEMGLLMRSILEVSRLDADLVTPCFEPITLAPLLQELVAEVASTAAAKGLRVRLAPTSLVVRSDRDLLATMLGNLLANAVRFTAKGGLLVGCRRRGDRVRVVVADTGIGIAQEHIPLIFHEFFQVGNSSRDRSLGLGLGLSVAQRAARLLGHRLDVSSRPGSGSVFAVTLPLA